MTYINSLINYLNSSGQKCMSLSVVILVGKAQSWVPDIAEKMKQVKIGNGIENKIELGPVISKQSKERILNIINLHEKEGGKVYLDGRKTKVENYENGNFIGPTILTEGSLDGIAYKEELFGPVLLIINAKSLEEAMEIINKSKLGNGASLFTKPRAPAFKNLFA